MGLFDAAFFASVVGLTVPLLWATLGELISERAGVFNIGIEGMVILGAFSAFYVAYETGSAWLGLLAGVLGGMLLAAAMAALSINLRADQVVVGLGLFLTAAGATVFIFQEQFTGMDVTAAPTLGRWETPLLSEIPLVGEALFNQGPLVYLCYLAVPLVYFLLWRTKWGLVVRASGEAPEAVAAAGSSVLLARWTGVLAAGAGGGLAGATLTIGALGVFSGTVSAGRGFLALAAVLLARWNPLGALAACLVFGGAEALQLRLQAIDSVPPELWVLAGLIALATVAWAIYRRDRAPLVPARVGLAIAIALGAFALALIAPTIALPSQFWLMFPYVLVLLVLAGLVGRSRMPSALGQPYAPT